ncbi:MAG: thiamine pyrophosphate-dependent dehydrogenase E1 component subunit alpha [Pseudomonadales bacterium]|jgi:2-oxoisovalerate dehydrogenase E1 component alpha subunit|nr:thiamine pyrophosphate-dependent dehydrogenase E1 component subunit alpha [Pseudomonadales bacterium]MDP7358929.1 thiamine pyrophosphate-dependent dehydrogenase E1 component subunit alpha [Pseudomonadales bacterium]MDP7596512.1 thiamine pyrophosphate-dependent dehydrogenase E1 component subunit alpha [Pseudomonadales bacterium]HJN49590.1 thiamine pyrophosphate-dependent dehydrogenase E1 component subunit alpha [Pseudomonadales bacterium]|tara:strand:- start:4635 stop:5864 length:1230 start_codon:yes stop_codon:yes gene_type:complete
MSARYHSKLRIPEAPFRPRENPDYSFLHLPSPEDVAKPDCMADADTIRQLAFSMVRVLDDDQNAKGAWDPQLPVSELLEGLRIMTLTRLYDDRLFRMQRQGKLSFYVKCTGEEAIAVAQAMALRSGDMLFPTYRQQGLLLARGRELVDMMCNCISNSRDNQKGRQLPSLYSWKEGNFFSVSGNLATQFSQAVGWAMASAYKGEDHIASAWVGEGSSAEADVYHALLFASAYQAPVLLNLVNNQWAISTPQTVACGGTTFAVRGLGFNLPSIRVDGNDLLAVYAVTRWAAERARLGGGPTFIELFTYRAEGHSTSDDPDAYRPKDEWHSWPLGDPVARLKTHLIQRQQWSDEKQEELEYTLTEELTEAWGEAESYGSLQDGPHWPLSSMFDDVFKEMPAHLRRQRHQMEM